MFFKLNKNKIISFALIIVVLLIGGGVYYFKYQEKKQVGLISQQYEQLLKSYSSLSLENVDFKKSADEFEQFLKTPNIDIALSPEQIGTIKIFWADSMSENNPVKEATILKEVAIDSKYPNEIRSWAINFLVNKYELDPNLNYDSRYDFNKNVVFTGDPFKDFIKEDDVELAVRKLNEWSYELTPNAIAGYRIAKWYASQIYQNPFLSQSEKTQFSGKVDGWLNRADSLFSQYKNAMLPQRIGQAYELKARTLYMAGKASKEEIESYLKKSVEAFKSPQTIYQSVYFVREGLYYLEFLAKEYGNVRAEDIQRVLKVYSDYLETPQEPRNRNVRLVKILIAARDSDRNDYPFADFNKQDIDNLGRIDPRFKNVVDNLNFFEYIKGHPLEARYQSGELKAGW